MSTSIYRKDYKAPQFTVERIELDFDLYDEYVMVINTMLLTRLEIGDLVLHGQNLELISIQLNGKILAPADYELNSEALQIPTQADTLELTITTRIYPQKNTELSGLYRSNALFCTQCEAEGFRCITFFLDRPDVLTTYTTRISADKTQYPILLSNGNLIASGDGENGRHWVVWQDPFKKPSYLFALVAGKLDCVEDVFITHSGKEVALKIFVEPGQTDKCAHAMRTVKNSMRWDEKVYGLEYDLSIFMIVAVSDFNMGAMENKGLNIFNSKYILVRNDTATDQDFLNVESVVAHEYFHNWTGNRVTCRDWFQLSLKEGLTVFRDQEFSRDMNSRDVSRIEDVRVLRATQFPEDAGKMAHPVRPESYEEINNFYTATIYNKGAEVIRMQHTLLGDEGFRRGMDCYFERHDGQAVTIDDFVAAMEDANGVDLSQLSLWYSQAGTPEVKVETYFENDTLSIELSQSCPPTPGQPVKKPFQIPIRFALFTDTGERIPVKHEILELKEAKQRFTFPNLARKPIVSLLRDFSAPIKLHQTMSMDERLKLLRFETNGYCKWDIAQKLAIEWIHKQLAESQPLPQALIDTFHHVLLDEQLDPHLRAELILPPDFESVVADLSLVDVTAVEDARRAYRQQLCQSLLSTATTLYNRLWEKRDDSIEAMGWRKLRNLCLWLMMKGNEAEALALCTQQFDQATSMSDQLASFSLLCNSQSPSHRQAAIDSFFKQWAHDDLVLDKWFAMQAMSELPDTLQRVEGLLGHPAFSIKNPNKVRSLISAFCQNPRQFHQINGEGYAFLTRMIEQIDIFNSKISASLAKPFSRWQHLDFPRQSLIKQQLLHLSRLPLSKDLAEIVHKSA